VAHRNGRRPRLTVALRERLGRLLPMWYRPVEVAEILGVCKDTVQRGWVRSGAPHIRDEDGLIWVAGEQLVAWLEVASSSPSGKGVSLGRGEAFCLSCQAAVRISGDVSRELQGPAILVSGECEACGANVARFVSARRGEQGGSYE
jgi:hypothetical protein